MPDLLNKTATTTAARTDLVYVVRDPSGTPVDRKMAINDFFLSQTGNQSNLAFLSLASAISFIGVNQATIEIAFPTTVSADLTIPANVTLLFAGTGQISVSSGKVLTILSGSDGWPLRQLFAGSGTVSFAGNTLLSPLYARWWGSDTAALQAAITAGISSGLGRTVRIFPLTVTGNIAVSSVRGFRLEGDGDQCKLTWGGNSSTPMFTLGDVADSTFADFEINASAATPLNEAFRIENNGGSSVAPALNYFRNIYIEGTNGGIDYGFRGKIGAGGDANNDFMHFENCRVTNYTHSGWSIEGTQCFGWKMTNCHAVGGQYAVSGGSTGAQSAFAWDGGAVGNHSVADFYVAPPSGFVSSQISNVNSEGSDRFLKTTGSAGSRCGVTCINVRYSSDNMNADGFAVYLLNPGPFIFINCAFGNDGTDSVKMHWSPGSGLHRPYFAFIGSMLITTETTLAGAFPFSVSWPIFATGSSLVNSSEVTTLWVDSLDAVADNGALQGAAWGGFKTLQETTTIAAAATTDTTIQIPANAIVMSVSVRTTVTIPTAATYTVTGATSTTVFNTAAVSTTATATDMGTQNCPYKNGAAQAIRITPNLTPATNVGRVRVTLIYYLSIPATV